MNTLDRARVRQLLAVVALALALPVAGCSTEEPPKTIDVSTPAKPLSAPTAHPVQPTTPAK